MSTDTTPKTKRCTKCGRVKILRRFPQNRGMKDGYRNECKACTSRYHQNWTRENPDSWNAIRRRNYANHPESKRASSLRHYYANREQYAEWHRVYQAENREHLNEYARARYATPHGRAIALRAMQKRRALLLQAPHLHVSAQQMDDKWEFWSGKCWVCGDDAEDWDHVKPLTYGGLHAIANLRPACKSCNRRKGGHWPLPSRAWIAGLVEGPAE